jgi:hypothetical protein
VLQRIPKIGDGSTDYGSRLALDMVFGALRERGMIMCRALIVCRAREVGMRSQGKEHDIGTRWEASHLV